MNNELEKISQLHMVGYGGFGKEIEFLIKSKFPHITIIPYDDNVQTGDVKETSTLLDISDQLFCVIAIGDPLVREKVFNYLKRNKNLYYPNIILSTFDFYNFSKNNFLGYGNIIMPQAIIGYNTIIGNFNIIGVNSGLGHDVSMGNFNFVGPNSFFAGSVKIDSYCKLSFGTFILQNISISSYVNSFPYTSFYKNIKIPGTYHGNPAKLI